VWEWYNALYRIMSQNRFPGTATIYGLKQNAAGTNVIETVAVTLFGVLIDNSQAAEDAYLGVSNVAATPGTTDTLGYYFAPRNTVSVYAIPQGTTFSSRLECFSVLGTEAGLEAGTASTTQPSVVLVYTK
jgi:hypothetical protein